MTLQKPYILNKLDVIDSQLADIAVNVKSFGATGNGVTDDTQFFINAIQSANGKPVLVPDGNYVVSLDLTDENVHFVGTGTLIHQQAKSVIKVKRTLGTPVNITSIGTVQIGANSPSIGIPTETNTKIVTGSSLVGVNQGDIFHISSQDTYSFCTQMSVEAGSAIQVWKAGFVPVHGIGLNYTGAVNGGFVENDTVVGATSGATALILSKTDTLLVFGKVSGDFVNGENLQVGGVIKGVASGVPYIIMSGRLIDTYTTSPVLRKVPTDKKFIIDGLKIKANGDVDSIVGAANRQPAFLLMGAYRPVVKNFTIESAWTRCLQLQSCYQGDLDVFIKKLPDNANVSESAYGYGVELAGATEGCSVRVNGGNCRHGFTTNVYWGGFQFMDVLSNGTIKYNTVHNSFIKNAFSASFDTHQGAYFTSFENCRSVNSSSGLRNITASAGFQNRGFGTTYTNCHDNGSVVGFIELGSQYESGFIHNITYRSCASENYQQYGFAQLANSVSNNAHLNFVNCSTSGDGSSGSLPYYQVGFSLKFGITTLRNCSSLRFNGAPYRFEVSSSGRFNMIDCFADYFDCPTYTAGIRFDGAPTEFNLQNYKVRKHPSNSNTPVGLLRIAAGAVTINTNGITCINSTAPYNFADITGGSLTVNQTTAQFS